jgi:hypothetical protein
MYIELLTTATIVQRALADAYVASGRMKEIGLYFLTHNYTTVAFFEQIIPPDKVQTLHEAFLQWQRLGIDALAEELEVGRPINSEKARQHVEASQRFAETLATITKSSIQ